MSGLRRPRTRVYDCNYRAGEKYYKPTLDDLDRKHYGKSIFAERALSPRPTVLPDPIFDEPLSTSRRRAERVIQDNDAFFDVRGTRIPKSQIGSGFEDFEDEMKSSISRMRANKKTFNVSDDADFDEAVNSARRRARDAVEKFDAAFDDDKAAGSTSIKKSSFKLRSRQEEDTAEPVNITKWSAVASSSVLDDENSTASLRAKATKARLDDLENEIFERSEKQLAREKRSQQLKQFLADSDISI